MSNSMTRKAERYQEKVQEKAYVKSLQAKGKKIVGGKIVEIQKPYRKEKTNEKAS